jgi:tripeptide aminopeptidase
MREPIGAVDRERLIDTFVRLARIDSPSRGEAAVAAVVRAELEALGFAVIDDGSGPSCGNLIARPSAASRTRAPLFFASHLDVVEPCRGVQPRVADGQIHSDGTTVLGADAKASVAALLEVVDVLASGRATNRRPPLELVFTWGEEDGHLGAKALDVSQLHARRAYVLDGLTPVGTIVVAAPTYYAFSVRISGRAAHAGVEPEHGISAIAVGAQAIARLKWGRLDESTTANVGTISGGSARNAVPAELRLEGEVRSLVTERADEVVGIVREVFESVVREAGASVEVDIERRYLGYELGADDDVVRTASDAFAHLEVTGGGPSTLLRTGGGSDANELNARGISACVLGIGAEQCHSVQERISVEQLELLTAWVLEIITSAA